MTETTIYNGDNYYMTETTIDGTETTLYDRDNYI